MPMRRLLALTLLLALVVAGTARADYHAVIRDCAQHSGLGRLFGHYPRRDLQLALEHLPADVTEYTDCRTLLMNLIAGYRAGRGFQGFTEVQSPSRPGSSPLSSTVSPAAGAALDRARASGDGPIALSNGVLVRPGARRTAASISDVPTPLLVAAILLAVATLAGAGPRLGRRVLARRSQ